MLKFGSVSVKVLILFNDPVKYSNLKKQLDEIFKYLGYFNIESFINMTKTST